MSDEVYKKLKKQNGERFAQIIRDHHNGLLEIPDIDAILQYAGRDAKPLLPFLITLLTANDNNATDVPASQDPFVLLDHAGYDAFYADTLDKQNSIAKYFKKDELLCTFNDNARCEDYHIVHAVKKDADDINRTDFNGKEDRQDEYGTSVISIQMLKRGGFISIKNRYNHTVAACDNTFNSNPDNIIQGLSNALRDHFNVEFSATESPRPDGYALIGNKIFKHNKENNNTYYGDQAWAKNGIIHKVDRGNGDALFDEFLFDNKTKTLSLPDPDISDSFVDDFNKCYGGNRSLHVDRGGNLRLGDTILIGAEQSLIKSLYLPGLTEMSDCCLQHANSVTHFDAPDLISMGSDGLYNAVALTNFDAPLLKQMGECCLHDLTSIKHLNLPNLTTMGHYSLRNAHALTHFSAPVLKTMNDGSLWHVANLTHCTIPSLTFMGNRCLQEARSLTHFHAPKLTSMGQACLFDVEDLEIFNVPALEKMDTECLVRAHRLKQCNIPLLTSMKNECFGHTRSLKRLYAPSLVSMGDGCFRMSKTLTHINTPALKTMGTACFAEALELVDVNAPSLIAKGPRCFINSSKLKQRQTISHPIQPR